MDELRFLRPLWLAGAAGAPLLAALAWWGWRQSDPWRRACDERLLGALRSQRSQGAAMAPFVLAGAIGLLGAVALAGPSWDTTEVPVFRSPRARVLVLDLSRSMNAEDVEPSRIARARAKAAALLARTAEARTGLVVFAGDGFAILPLTTDDETITGLLPAFDPSVMPVQGSRPDRGLQEAAALLGQSGSPRGDIVLISDGARGRRAVEVAAELRAQGIRISVLAVGTPGGGRIPLSGGGFLRDLEGHTLVAETPLELLRDIARAGGGRFVASSQDDGDIDYLLAPDGPADDGPPQREASDQSLDASDRPAALWINRGPWLAVALLPLAALAFRRGWLLALACLALVPAPPARAAGEADVVAESSQAPPAAEPSPEARDGDWRWLGVDLYRAGRFQDAANMFANGNHADDHYNRGNALARAGLLRAALAAYAEAIARERRHADARFNRGLVANLLEQRTRRQESRERSTEDLELFAATGEATGASAAGEGFEHSDTSAGDAPDQHLEQAAERSGEDQAQTARAAGAEATERTDERSAPEAPPVSISALELEQIEEVLGEISEERLGLWRRKIELLWTRRAGRLPTRTDAW